MRAVVYRSIGGPDVVEVAEIDKPVPGLSEIRIKVQASALNPTDLMAWSSGFFPAPPEECLRPRLGHRRCCRRRRPG